MSEQYSRIVGTVWDAKDGSRAIRIESDFIYLGQHRLGIINLETRRVTEITLSGLRRKFIKRTNGGVE